MNLYRFHWDCGRMGELDGLFAVDEAGEARLRALIGEEINFGEVLGKHSEIYGELEAEHLTFLPATDDEIATILRVCGCVMQHGHATISGFSPLDYARVEDCEDPDSNPL